MTGPVEPLLTWCVRERPRRRWRGLLVRTVASADVVAPDGRRYAVRVARALWPGGSPLIGGGVDLVPDGIIGDAVAGASLLASRIVWSVRVFGARNRFHSQPLVYGEELRDREASVRRGLEIAQGLARGRRP